MCWSFLFSYRKRASAVCRIEKGTGQVIVNRKELCFYFPDDVARYRHNGSPELLDLLTFVFRDAVLEPLVVSERLKEVDVKIHVTGGGTTGWSRVLCEPYFEELTVSSQASPRPSEWPSPELWCATIHISNPLLSSVWSSLPCPYPFFFFFDALCSGHYLTRDSREVERKKYGQKKARKKFQWVKR